MTRAPTDRAHLSIGEVLSLLQRDFPDVTISKIRFLESQGLLDPERTPSGYRKFYDDDIERLRWILQQQKEHYLPLKVIRDRLDNAGSPPTNPASPSSPEADHYEFDDSSDTGLEPAFAGATRVAHDRVQHERTIVSRASHRDAASAAGVAGPPGREPDVDAVPTPASSTAGPAAVAPGAQPLGGQAAAPRLDVAGGEHPGVRGAADIAGPTNRPEHRATGESRGEPVTTERPRPDGPVDVPAQPASSGPTSERSDSSAHLGSGAASLSFTLDELAEAAGLSTRDIRDLERFGLLESFDVGDATYYDGEGLVIARTAAGFLRHGIEARHIRSYKVAVDREAGLFEQIVLPLLKQRNPDARRRATDTVSELVRLGETMRGALLRRELRDHLPPG